MDRTCSKCGPDELSWRKFWEEQGEVSGPPAGYRNGEPSDAPNLILGIPACFSSLILRKQFILARVGQEAEGDGGVSRCPP